MPPPTGSRSRRPHAIFALTLAALSALAGCSLTSSLRTELGEIGADVRAARQQGALRCAPRELALAEANHRFAHLELDQGSLTRARAHLRVASLHAQAALDRVNRKGCGAPRPPPAGSGVEEAPALPSEPDVEEAPALPSEPDVAPNLGL